jgi:fructokinase
MLPSGKMPGGAPMNVAIHLRNLGMEVACITKVGNDNLGDELKGFLKSKGCADTWVQVDQDHPTGTVNVNISERTNVQYEIVHPVAWDFISATPEALEVAKSAYAFVFGTLACRDQPSRDTLFKLLENSKAIKVFDVNLRAPYYSKELIESLICKADIVKMNEDELNIIHDWFELPSSALEQKVKSIKSKFGLKKVIVTRGGDGALLVDESGLYTSNVYKVEVKDTIGSGDSFLAGMIKNIYLKNSPERSLNYACALGALVAQHHGANPPIRESEILRLMNT